MIWLLKLFEICLSIKYAITQNIFNPQLYKKPCDLVRLPVAKSPAVLQKDLNVQVYGLKIYGTYRKNSVSCQIFVRLPYTIFMGLT
ncbi:hypothetical protein EGI24_05005 [Lacihabitans sp. CS3-21]|nr:hypothetical protein [Lacihabitans sp. CS3-21]